MTDFLQYQRQVPHVLGDTSVANNGQISLLNGLVDAAKRSEKEEIERDNAVNKLRYQNLAIESSARAYSQSPNDLDGYKKFYRKQLEGYPIPIARRHEYEAVALNAESRYYSPIILNRETTTRAEENNELLTLADNLCNDGLFVLGGGVPHPDGNYAGDRLAEALEVLGAQDGNGTPLLPADAIAGRVDKYGLRTLTTLAIVDVEATDDPIAAMADYVNGKDYVAKLNTSRGPIVLPSSSLSDGAQEQLRENIKSAIVGNLANKNARENFAIGHHLMEYPATYRGTSSQHHGLDQWASMQLASQPLTAENERFHIDNMIQFARQFSHIPEPYVEVLSANINGKGNPLVALSSAKLLNLAMERGGAAIGKQFDDVTLLKSQMLVDLIWNGNVDPQRALDSINSTFHDPRSRDYTVNLNEKLKSMATKHDREQFYGTAVDEKTYGIDGVAMYEELVRDLFLTNGGDGKSARKVAQARIDGIYSFPSHGYFQKTGWIFKTGGRKLKYQPEAYYGDGIGKKIDEEMQNSVIPMIRNELGYADISEKNYFLVANSLTADAFHAPSKTKQPMWEVWYVNEFGNRIRVTRANGDVLVYSTDPLPPQENKALKKMAENHGEKVRVLHDNMTLSDEERESRELKRAYYDALLPQDF
jgi:hypothetical protein